MASEVWKKVAFILAIGGAIQFLLIISLAIVFYGGGNSVNPSAPGYSFILNSWSDLGRTIAWSGENNLVSQVFFNIAMGIWAISFVPSIYALAIEFSESKWRNFFGRIGTISAFICGLSLFINLSFFPLDIHPTPHIVLSIIGYLALLVVEISFTYLMFSDANYPNTQAICFAVVAFVTVIYLIFYTALLQKMVSITLTIATVIVFYGDLKRMNSQKIS